MSTTEPVIKFSIEETKANLRSKIGQNLLNLVDLTKSTVKSSETSELFKQCMKTFAGNEQTIEASCEKLQKIEIISAQLNYQVDALRNACAQLGEIGNQINSIQHSTSKRH